MENKQEIIAIKAVLDCECKRFGISASTTFQSFVQTLSNIFACDIPSIQYRDEDDDLISMGTEEEFVVALQSVPSTGGILRLVLGASTCKEMDKKSCTEQSSDDLKTTDQTSGTSVNEHDASIIEANIRNAEIVNSVKCETTLDIQETMEVNCMGTKDSKCTSGVNKKPSIRNKIESATKLSKDLSEVRGCIPVLPASSVCGLDTHFTSQNPGARKVRRVSSSTTSASTEKNDKKQVRGRQTQQKKKRKHRESSCSSSDSSTSRSSSLSSSSSSSGSSCEEDFKYYKKSKKKKRRSSPTVRIGKILQKCEKKITERVAKDMDRYTKNFKDDIVSSVTSSILQKLDGAVLQSFVVPNGGTAQTNDGSGASASTKPAEQIPTKRTRYQHQNVVCDHCENEIFGPRYKCGNCSDYDLCEKCEAIEGLHTPSHVFVKMHFPAVLVGRRSVGGKSRPLLRANIYEEREKEREMEDLLQRKLDSGSELNQKVMEKFEKSRTNMKEVEQAKEACHARKEEWKKMKKEIKKNKKELAKKIKLQGKMMQRNIKRGVVVVPHIDDGFCFDDYIPKVGQQVSTNKEDIAVNVKSHDDKLSSALSSLEIHVAAVEENTCDNDAVDKNNVTVGNVSSDSAMIDLTTDSDDIVVVHRDTLQQSNVTCSAPEALKKPDLVDFHRKVSVSTTASEDFVVVSNYFDLAVPIDDKHVHEHRNCENCRKCSSNLMTDFVEPEVCASSNELPMDLVASVPVTSRCQPDIATVSTVNIMDQSIEKISSVSSSPPISPEPLDSKQMDEVLEEADLIQAPEVFRTCITSQPIGLSNENIIINEPIPAPPETILIQPEPTEDVACKPPETELSSLDKSITDNSQDTVDEEQLSVDTSPPALDTDVDTSTQQQTLDMTNPIVQSQVAQEQCILNSLSLNSFQAARTEICDLQEEVIEESRPANRVTTTDASIVRTNSESGGFSGALVGAMATIVDTVAQVVQSAKGSPKAQYHNGEVQVTIPVDPRVEGMQQLLDMGFFDRAVNERLLARYNNDVGQCVGDLIAGGNNQWYQTRH